MTFADRHGITPTRRVRLVSALIAPLLCITLPVSAQVYRWVDSKGNVHFSDQAGPGAEQIVVPPVSTISLPSASDNSESTGSDSETINAPADEHPGYSNLRISFPEPDSAFHSGNGTFTVTTAIEPPLAPIDELRLLYDGQVYAEGQSGNFLMTNIDRGTHVLQLQVVRGNQVIQSTEPVSFTLHRPSLLNPNRPKPR